jgi:exodeoxyribonuclease VII large subunit
LQQPLLASLFDQTERVPLSVSELTVKIRDTLEKGFATVWVEGEISNFRQLSSGHWYFTLKDEFAQLRSACYRSSNQRIRFRLEDGLQVRARGRLSVYEPKGEYQLIVETLEPVGAGALQLAFEQTKARLQAEGLFATEIKRPIPYFPRRIGVVTSAGGAAIRDIINVISRRTRTVHLLFAPARVQGEGASNEIARAIRFLNDHHERSMREGRHEASIDVLIVGRGGGSIEDLWAFNEEVVARAIRSSAIPVISAVGHETDFTIADFVADLRAATPSAAAELVAAHEEELCSKLDQMVSSLKRSLTYRWREALSEVDARENRLRDAMNLSYQSASRRFDLAARLLSPAELHTRALAQRARFDALFHAHNMAMQSKLENARRQFGLGAASLDAMSPLKVLERGYSITQNSNGTIVRDAANVSVGDELQVRLWKGAVDCRVEKIES